jgi:hypothetical protein
MAAARGGGLEASDLRGGFVFDGERVRLINPQRGIFKPRLMGWLLSLRTVVPRSGALTQKIRRSEKSDLNVKQFTSRLGKYI